MMSYFTSKAIFALVPRDSKLDRGDIDIVFQSVATEGIGSSSLYGDDLINPLSVFTVAFERNCVGTATDRILSCGESTTIV